jgi:hypothetical protein
MGRFKAIEGQITQYCVTKDALVASLESQTEHMKSSLLKLDSSNMGLNAL